MAFLKRLIVRIPLPFLRPLAAFLERLHNLAYWPEAHKLNYGIIAWKAPIYGA